MGLRRTRPPDAPSRELHVLIDDNADQKYTSDAAEIHCEYELSHTNGDYFYFQVQSAPVMRIVLAEPIHPIDWLDEWVEPLAGLLSFATMEPQRAGWVSFVDGIKGKDHTFDIRYQLFAEQIAQVPYAPHKEEDDAVALFTFVDEPGPLELLSQWRRTQQEIPGIIAPLLDAITNPRLHIRARFLQLVQAVEGLHRDKYGDGRRTVDEHKAIRRNILAKVKAGGSLTSREYRWLDHWLDRYGRYSLQDRLDQLFLDLPRSLQAAFDPDFSANDIPKIRNDLSHGVGDHEASLLKSRARALQTTALVLVLRRMGLPTDRLEALATRR